METKEGLDSEALQVTMENQVYRVSPVNQDLQDNQRTLEVWEPRWPEGSMEKQDLRP